MTLRELLDRPIERGASPGLIAAIVDHQGIREIAVAGVRKAGFSQALLTTDSLHIGSNTKAMTSALLAALVDDGVFSGGWNTTIADVFPELLDEIHRDYQPVNLWQLVTMVGGIKPDAEDWHAHQGLGVMQRRYGILRDNLVDSPAAAVGEYLYSNLGYVVAGTMAERVTGKLWETLMQERLFGPLGMSRAGFGPPGSPGELDQPWGHRRDPQSGDWLPNQIDNAPALGPAGTVHLPLEDWSKFIALWLPEAPPAILDRATLDRLIRPASRDDAARSIRTLPFRFVRRLIRPAAEDYAAGWTVVSRSWAQGEAITHSGSNTSWCTTLWIAPTIGRAYVVAANCADTDLSKTFRMLDGIVANMIRYGLEE